MNDEGGNFKGREFICSCGKNYLSYAALFTHIKQKHDGKAPGPIVRPRSQRKRGRPRKNPQAQNERSSSNSDKPQNGISKSSDNNNIAQKKEDQEKTKKAAQLLGCGGFVAFTAYKPQPIRPSPKKITDSAKKNFSKRNSIQSIERKCSLLSLTEKQGPGSFNSKVQIEQERTAMHNFIENLSALNKCELLKIFNPKPTMEQEVAISSSQMTIFEELGIDPQTILDTPLPQPTQTLAFGLSQFLKFIKNITNSNQSTQHDSLQMISEVKNTSYEEATLFIGFLLQYTLKQCQNNLKQLQSKQFMELADYMTKFVLEYLPSKIVSHRLKGYVLFRQLNPIKFVLFIQNWLAIKKTQSQFLQTPTILQNEPQKSKQQLKLEQQDELQPQNNPSNEIQNKIQPKQEQLHELKTPHNNINLNINININCKSTPNSENKIKNQDDSHSEQEQNNQIWNNNAEFVVVRGGGDGGDERD